jgi:hypothetical protein
MARTATDKTNYITAEQFRLLGAPKRGGRAQRGKPPRATSPLPKVLENDIRAAIKEFLELHGWWVWVNWQGPFSYKGVTDLTAIRGGEVWWVEVKRPGEQLRPDQARFKELMEEYGGNWLLAEGIEDVEFLCRRGAK